MQQHTHTPDTRAYQVSERAHGSAKLLFNGISARCARCWFGDKLMVIITAYSLEQTLITLPENGNISYPVQQSRRISQRIIQLHQTGAKHRRVRNKPKNSIKPRSSPHVKSEPNHPLCASNTWPTSHTPSNAAVPSHHIPNNKPQTTRLNAKPIDYTYTIYNTFAHPHTVLSLYGKPDHTHVASAEQAQRILYEYILHNRCDRDGGVTHAHT